MVHITIISNVKSTIDEIMEYKSVDRLSAEAIKVKMVSKMLTEKCFSCIHKDEIPSIIVALEDYADSLKNVMSREEMYELKDRYEKLRAEMSATTMIMEVNDDSL